MNARMAALAIGVTLIVIALILGGLQDLHIASFYGDIENKWYFYGAIGAALVVGIIFAAWGLLRKEAMKQSSPT